MSGKASSGLYALHRSTLVAYATPILGSREAAEDVVQDAFLNFAPANADGSLSIGYLYRTVRNLAFDVLKRRRIERRVQLESAPDWTVPKAETSPETQAAHRQELRIVARAMETLPPDQRTAVEMYRIEGATLGEIAGHLGVSVATAHRLVRAGLAGIAAVLEAATA